MKRIIASVLAGMFLFGAGVTGVACDKEDKADLREGGRQVEQGVEEGAEEVEQGVDELDSDGKDD
jgi:hypothetical protein